MADCVHRLRLAVSRRRGIRTHGASLSLSHHGLCGAVVVHFVLVIVWVDHAAPVHELRSLPAVETCDRSGLSDANDVCSALMEWWRHSMVIAAVESSGVELGRALTRGAWQ